LLYLNNDLDIQSLEFRALNPREKFRVDFQKRKAEFFCLKNILGRAVKNPIFRVHGRYRSLMTLTQRPVPCHISTMVPCDAPDGVRTDIRKFIFGDAYE